MPQRQRLLRIVLLLLSHQSVCSSSSSSTNLKSSLPRQQGLSQNRTSTKRHKSTVRKKRKRTHATTKLSTEAAHVISEEAAVPRKVEKTQKAEKIPTNAEQCSSDRQNTEAVTIDTDTVEEDESHKRKRPQTSKKKSISDERVGNDEIEERKRPQTPKKKSISDEKNGIGARKTETARKESGGREAACLRRIKREWRDAVKMGIAYDWVKMQTVQSRDSSSVENKRANEYVRIGPLGKNLLRWHFSVMGPSNSVYEGGVYHGRVYLPKNYPGSPPRIQVLTPSGRFIPSRDICLSASSFHPEAWTPRWTVLSLVDALRLHMLTTANEIGGMNASPDERRQYARASRRWKHGRVDHEQMIQDGVFPWHDDEQATSTSTEKPDNKVQMDSGSDGGSKMTVKQTVEVRVRKQVPRNANISSILIRAVVEVFTSPPRLVVLALLTIFVILNRH